MLASVGLWDKGKLLPPWESDRRLNLMTEEALTQARTRGAPIPQGTRARVAIGPFNRESGRPYIPPPEVKTRTCFYTTGYVSENTRCDAERCTFPDGQFCLHSTGQCHDADGTLILDLKGNYVSDSIFFPYDWKGKMCLDTEGTALPPSGEKPYAERYKAGCSYRIDLPNYTPWNTDFLLTCDAHRCFFPGGGYWRFDTRRYYDGAGTDVGNTPTFTDFSAINWTCLDIKKVKNFRKQFLCDYNGENTFSGCQVCYENYTHVYKNCAYTYNEYGERTGKRLEMTEEFLRELNRFKNVIGDFIYQKDFLPIAKRMTAIEIRLYERTPSVDEERIVRAMETFNAVVEPKPRSVKKISAALAVLEAELKTILSKK